jgi:hypothetical protein
MEAQQAQEMLNQLRGGNTMAAGMASLSGAKSLQPFAQMTGNMAHQQGQLLGEAGIERLKLAQQDKALQRQQFNADRTFQLHRDQFGALAGYRDQEMALQKAKFDAMNGSGSGMDPAALDMYARAFLKMGPSALASIRQRSDKVAIVNRASVLNPDADVAGNAAQYHALGAAKTALAKQSSGLNVAESTARSNLQTLVDATGKLTNTHIPLLNRGLRWGQENLLGDPDVKAFNNARTVAATEISKVLTQGTLSGGQAVSDHARAEAREAFGTGDTPEQIAAAARIILRDMDNRATAQRMAGEEVDRQLQNVGGATGGTLGTPQQTAAPAQEAPAATPRRRTYNPATGGLE